MVANFYENTSDDNTLDKSLTLKGTTTVTLKDNTELIDPTIIISPNINYDFNYVYIQDFNRYYFVTSKTYSQQRYYVTLHIDVLMSFKEEIKDLTVIATRSSSRFNLYQVDNQISKTAKGRVSTTRFRNGFKGQSIILSVNGS